MGYLFVTEEGMADPSSITTIAVLWWKQRVVFGTNLPWKKGIVWCLGIDTDARWGYSHTKGWIFGYKLHLTSTAAIDEIDTSNYSCYHCQFSR
jgi:hypothetical protein